MAWSESLRVERVVGLATKEAAMSRKEVFQEGRKK